MLTVFKLPTRHSSIRRFFAIFSCGLLLVMVCQRSPVAAQGVNRATLTEILDSPQVFIQNKPAKVKESANKGQKVRTAEARAQIQFNTGAVGRLGHNSVLTVGQCARLQRGQLLVNGAMNGCTASVVAGVRGTTYVMEVDDAGEASIKVLEGEVSVTRSPVPLTDETDINEPGTGSKQLVPPRTSLPIIPPRTTLPTTPPRTTPTATPPRTTPTATIPTTTTTTSVTPPPVTTPAGITIPIAQPQTPNSDFGTFPDPNFKQPDSLLKIELPLATAESPVLHVQATTDDSNPVVLQAGEKVSVSATGKVGLIEKLSQEEFTRLLQGGLLNGFTVQIPGISKIQQSFQSLFPGVPFPISIPGIPIPGLPIRLPF